MERIEGVKGQIIQIDIPEDYEDDYDPLDFSFEILSETIFKTKHPYSVTLHDPVEIICIPPEGGQITIAKTRQLSSLVAGELIFTKDGFMDVYDGQTGEQRAATVPFMFCELPDQSEEISMATAGEDVIGLGISHSDMLDHIKSFSSIFNAKITKYDLSQALLKVMNSLTLSCKLLELEQEGLDSEIQELLESMGFMMADDAFSLFHDVAKQLKPPYTAESIQNAIMDMD